MLLHWGADGFAFWAIILSARAILLFLSDGFVRYIVNQYNLLFHTDEAKANAALSSGISFLSIFSIFLCAIIAVLFGCIPSVSAFVFSVGNDQYNYLPLCLVAFISAASMQTIQRMYAGTKEARALVWNNLLIEVVLVAAEIILLSSLLLLNFNFTTVVFADSGLIFFTAVIYIFYLKKNYPLPAILKLHSIKNGATHFLKATQLYASNFFEKLTTDGLVLLLSFFRFDKAAIALFATIRTIVNTPLLAQNLLLNTYTPQLQKDFSLRDSKALEKLLRFIRLRIGALLCLGILVCLPLYEPVFSIWTKGEIVYNKLFMLLMLISTVFNLYGLTYAFVLKGINAYTESLAVMIVKTVVLLAGFILWQQSLIGFGISLMFVEFLSCVVLLPLLTHRYFLKQNFDFRLEISFLGFVPYLITVLMLVAYLLFSIFISDFKMTL